MKWLLLFSLVFMTACATVKPYHRDILSKPVMQLDKEQAEVAAREHFLNSLEGSSGGFGVGGGGCGCN